MGLDLFDTDTIMGNCILKMLNKYQFFS